jgi:hypothetical protein
MAPEHLHSAVKLAVLDALRSPDVQLALAAVSRDAAKAALRDQLLQFGIDTDKPQQTHEDLAALARWVDMWANVKSTLLKSVVGAVVAGFIALIVIGTQDWIWQVVKSKH